MEATGENADSMSGRATLPGLTAALLHGIPASGRPASAGSGTAVADASSSDGGAAAGLSRARLRFCHRTPRFHRRAGTAALASASEASRRWQYLTWKQRDLQQLPNHRCRVQFG
ncbi:hypothetical protein QF036_000689 [Arthrobacter globiformis]|nr:hypothetical protein [Arthrobacter globiformis]